MNPRPSFQQIPVLGLTLHSVSEEQLHNYFREIILGGEKSVVLNLNINCVNLACDQPWLKDFINSAQLVFCDGDGVRWGCKLLGYEPPPKITYDRWIWQLAEFCEQQNFSLFFLGAKPGVAEEAARRLKEKSPKLKIAVHHGYFDKQGTENTRVIDEINRFQPNILIVGFGMPAQEKWLSENWKKIDANIFLTGGAVFDYAAGRARRAPEWMIQLQLEWLFRFICEPRRLFVRYVIGNPLFFIRIFRERLRRRRNNP